MHCVAITVKVCLYPRISLGKPSVAEFWITLITDLFVIVVFLFISECKRLDEYIHHYEELTYNTEQLHTKHMRHKRSLDNAVHFNFNAFDK